MRYVTVVRSVLRYKWTIGASLIFGGMIGWAVAGHEWRRIVFACAYGAVFAAPPLIRDLMLCRNRRKDQSPAWGPSGSSLPCPPGCRIRIAHRHDRMGSVR